MLPPDLPGTTPGNEEGAPLSLPLSLKIAYTLFVCVVVAVYWVKYGASNFLWFSDVALFVTVAAIWLESGLLASMMTLSILLSIYQLI